MLLFDQSLVLRVCLSEKCIVNLSYLVQKGCIPFAIYEGFQGLVDGKEKIKELKWDDVRGYLSKVNSFPFSLIII